ncbi:acyl-homoserine-lactone acylase [Kitasatospora sp. MAA19]|uniref:penicillin acylase family protein n=1 Tax=unclassified Kitasatospora TaxID=2633591 RepID=UPI00247662E9|nr:penicillin acylase family protein [Kitasatospora sp. MAA19]MDH6707358.1 acyl-homoserine-lactone acylase [Kitasatospora sp. MAA19]
MTSRHSTSPSKRVSTGLAALCLASVTAGLLPGTAVAADSDGQLGGRDGYSAQIRRTEYGIPHILAHDFRGLGYGYGYAFAQDNLCELADQVLTVRGERARYLGLDATAPSGSDNLTSDVYHQGLQRSGSVKRLLDKPAPLGPTDDVRRLVEGYAAGYNRYLSDTGVDRLPDAGCRGQDWVRPITAEDVWGMIYEVDTAAGLGGAQDAIASATPPTPGAPAVPSAPAPASAPSGPAPASALPKESPGRDPELGSNGWALGRDVTRDHDAMLLANPHLPWTGSDRFYQVQLTIPGVLDVSGAGLYGTPLVEIGHTRNVAFTATSSFAQHAAQFRLTLVPGDPTSYLVDGKAEPMGRQEVPVTVRGTDGTLSTVTRTLYTSRYGPVLGGSWSTEHAYALRDANAENLRSMNGWLAMDRAQSLAELKQADDTYQGNPWNYTIATDSTGETYFTDSSAVPHLTDAQLKQCALPPVHDEPVGLDGSVSACDAGSDPDAVVPGIFGPANHPKVSRTDYVANSNNNPYLANPAAPITGYPTVYGTFPGIGTRAQLGLRMIADRRDGSDGLGAPGFTLSTLQAAMFGDRVYSAELGRDDAVAMCRANPVLNDKDGHPVDVSAACEVLAAWSTRADADGHGAVLWGEFVSDLYRYRTDAWERIPFDPAHPLTTPAGIRGDSATARTALAAAVRQLATDGTALDATVGEVQRWAGIPLHGCDSGEGCFDVVRAGADSGSTGAAHPDGTAPAYGSSFVMATELTPQGPRTRTVLTYGESVNPASPHYTDQTGLYSRKQWVTERFTEAEIKASPHLETTSLRG